ncbi:DeoR/GlpR family DNA-binding transcription regulator [Lysinibacillus sp. G4S2]|uniref:DeoR/GlpR family DNA-binding transcription regulator n=1 Tax=Lysinibacillus sp. G4S2 TaxID=3055859 RepID=UPI0025A27DD0|nr:DeoR/GlpR family DNA-binding transcription regulator [Lysinibacillus sp. G4S2]MDM5247045.1 DeoR/GlpR family DNA-binding transcription regulator [Lysinibacillus sp. G4S2]
MTYAKIERFEFILKQLEIDEKIIVANIAEELQVAPETIRRDFDELEQQRLLTRVHGGAVKYTHVRNEPVFLRKLQMQKEAKRNIARLAARRICDGDTIAVDTGTTTVHIADFLLAVDDITVVTNSIAAAVQFNLAIEERRMTGKVILLGGTTNPRQSSVAGAMTMEVLGNMNFDKAFISCGGISEGIVYDYDLDESLISKKMIEHSKMNFLLADASKINGKSFYQICHLEECSDILCDVVCPVEWQAYEEKWTVCNGGKSE